jgi:hypothetical protein
MLLVGGDCILGGGKGDCGLTWLDPNSPQCALGVGKVRCLRGSVSGRLGIFELQYPRGLVSERFDI